MATYSTEKGFTIQSLSSDPSPLLEGQVWYNTTTAVLKGATWTTGTGTWASGGTLNATHLGNAFGIGTQTAGIVAGGYQEPPTIDIKLCETYDGTSWSAGNDINTGRCQGASGGTTGAGLIFGGIKTQSSWTIGYADTEEYNGTSWSNVNNLTAAMAQTAYGCNGTQTAAMKAGSRSPPPAPSGTCSTYDGTSWSDINELNTGGSGAGAGNSTAAVDMGRDGGPVPLGKAICELYDGTCWSEQSNMNTPREGNPGAGSSTLALVIGGYGNNQAVEQWNGTTFTTVNSLANAYQYSAAAGTGTLALSMAGNVSTAHITTSEEWTQPTPVAAKTFTAT